jgi:hypothetical protein
MGEKVITPKSKKEKRKKKKEKRKYIYIYIYNKIISLEKSCCKWAKPVQYFFIPKFTLSLSLSLSLSLTYAVQ